ncbi:MAG: MFS transporter [Thermoanaerobaculia bacterium]
MPSVAYWQERLGLKQRVTALAAALFIFGFGQELWFRYLPEYLRVLGGSALVVGLFGTWKDLLDAAYAYPGGMLADRLGARLCLLLAGGASVAGVALYLTWPSLLAVFVGLMLVMCWSSLGLPSTFALIGEELAGARRVVAFSVQAVVKRIPILLAPPLGGLLLEKLGVRNGMRAGFAMSVVLAVFALLVLRRTPAPRPPSAAASFRGAGSGRVRLHPALRQLLIADCLIRLCEGLPDVFLVIWAIEVVKVSPAQFGILTSVLMGTAILSYLPAGSGAERIEKKPFVLLTYVFFSLFPLAVFLSRSFLPLLGAYVLGGLREIGEPARKALIVDLADPLARGKTVGLYYAIRGFSVAGAAAIGGLLWTIRPALTFCVAAALGLAGTAWAAAFLPRTPRPQEAVP